MAREISKPLLIRAVAKLRALVKSHAQVTSKAVRARRTVTRRGRKARDKAWRLPFEMMAQPNDVTCGPTCLHALYRFHDDDISLEQVIAEVEPTIGGGTLAVHLACHAMSRGYRATIYTYNLNVFDPTWFSKSVDIPSKLQAQMAVKSSKRVKAASKAYLKFFALGGELKFEELTSALLRRYLSRGTPILTGLSSTFLYECEREYEDQYDDVRGEPAGHFVVLSGYDNKLRQVEVADPLLDNPKFQSLSYRVAIPRLISAILLGIVTYDANLLVLTPPPKPDLD